MVGDLVLFDPERPEICRKRESRVVHTVVSTETMTDRGQFFWVDKILGGDEERGRKTVTRRNQHRKVLLALNGVLNEVLSICCLLIDYNSGCTSLSLIITLK